MKKPVVDYREFSLRKINDPRFSHLRLLLGWVVYFAAYFLTERFIPREDCQVIHCALDDAIPFCEYFVIPYVLWYVLIVGSLLYFLLYNVESFKKLQKFFIVTQVAAVLVYIFFPNCQNLRPDPFISENFFGDIVEIIYILDTNTNVCPSLHVAYSIGIASVWVKERGISPWVKTAILVLSAMVCLSTVFIKQHSVVDGLAAVPVALLAEWLIFRKYYREKRKRRKENNRID